MMTIFNHPVAAVTVLRVAAVLIGLGLAGLVTPPLVRWCWRRADERPPRRAVHVGVTLDSPPLADLMPAVVDEPVLTVEDLAAEAEVIVEHQHRDEDAIEAEVHGELAGLDDAIIRFRMAMAALEARFDRTPVPVFDRRPARTRAAWAEQTGQFSTDELHALLDAEGLVTAR